MYELAFTKPAGLVFKPGQFVLFDIPLVDTPSDMQTRALSIASTNDEPDLLFVVKLIPGGRISRWIVERLQEGGTAPMKGPFGLFVLDAETPKDYLFIATSAGIGPFRSQLKTALAGGDTRQMDLVFGVRAEEDLFWENQFRALAEQYENFYVHIVLSNPAGEWSGHRGRVQTLVPQIIKDFSQRNVYVCGNPDMTNEVKKLALEEWGIAKSDLHVEGYI